MLFLQSIDQILYSIIGLAILGFIIKTAIYIFVIRSICKYMAKQNAEAFDYDFMAARTAEEICRRMIIIEKQKAEAYKGATNDTGDQSTGDRTGAPEQIGSRQA